MIGIDRKSLSLALARVFYQLLPTKSKSFGAEESQIFLSLTSFRRDFRFETVRKFSAKTGLSLKLVGFKNWFEGYSWRHKTMDSKNDPVKNRVCALKMTFKGPLWDIQYKETFSKTTMNVTF